MMTTQEAAAVTLLAAVAVGLDLRSKKSTEAWRASCCLCNGDFFILLSARQLNNALFCCWNEGILYSNCPLIEGGEKNYSPQQETQQLGLQIN
jgi:hypothetical protein